MTDYDINKVSPRPWKIFWSGNEMVGIVNADGLWVKGTDKLFWESQVGDGLDNLNYIVHCVNEHDRNKALADLVPGLVEALETYQALLIETDLGAAEELLEQTLAEARRVMEVPTDEP